MISFFGCCLEERECVFLGGEKVLMRERANVMMMMIEAKAISAFVLVCLLNI